MDVERLNYQLKEESLAKLTRWVMKNDEGNFALRCDIDKLKMIKMIKKGIDYRSSLSFFLCDDSDCDELARLDEKERERGRRNRSKQ